jgi:transposase
MARIKGPRKVHRYSAEFKLKAVKLSQIEGVQVQDVADALDIHPFMLSRWRKEAREGRPKPPRNAAEGCATTGAAPLPDSWM